VLNAEELCDICATSAAQRQAWAKEGDLRRRRGFEELDAVELSTYARLRDVAGPKRGKAAWRALRTPIRRLLVSLPPRLWIVIEIDGVQRHALAVRPLELAQQVASGQPLVVVDLRDVIDGARVAYQGALTTKGRLNGRIGG
jgi:hypothetical protein